MTQNKPIRKGVALSVGSVVGHVAQWWSDSTMALEITTSR